MRLNQSGAGCLTGLITTHDKFSDWGAKKGGFECGLIRGTMAPLVIVLIDV